VQIKTDAEQKPASSVIRNIDLLEMNHIQLKSNQYGEPIALKTTEQTSPATHWFDVMTELRSLKNVEIEDQHLDAEQFSKIRDLHHLQALSIKKCKLPETTLVSLCTLQNLGWLDLRDSAISDVGLKFISRIPSLSNLCLSRTQITDQGLIHLKHALLLKDLVVKQCAYVTDDGLETLGALEQLKHLDIRNTGISQSGYQTLCEKLPGCKIRY